MHSLSKKAVASLGSKASRRPFGYGVLLVAILAGLITPLPAQGNIINNSGVALAASDPVIAAAGDIACDPANSHFNNGVGDSNACRQKFTSDLLVNADLAAVLNLGDNQYYCGGYQAFLQSYDLSWGRVKSIVHPSVGNHEYITTPGSNGGTGCDITNEGAAGYFDYFGSSAGERGKGYYSFDVGAWHLIALNSNCSDAGGCSTSSPQYQWLQADLAAHNNLCTLAFWHIPLFSSGGRAASNTRTFWQLLYNNNADLILNGHDHIYERFAPQDPTGASDPVRGMREFIVGTGGSDHTSIVQIFPNSQVRNTNTYGVLKLVLHSNSYDWQFVPESGQPFTDAGTGFCHGSVPDTTPPSTPSNLAATNIAWNQVNLSWIASTDNVGVVEYRIFRNGNQIGTTSSTSYVDTTVQSQTSYSYYVVAVDGSGLTSSPSTTLNVTTPIAPTILTFTPVADTFIQSNTPTSNFGASTQIITDNSPVNNMLLKFNVSGIGTQGILSAKLRLYCENGSPFGGEFHRVANTTWSEGTVNWNTAPPADAAVLATLGTVSSNNWYEVNVASLITGDGTYSLRVNSTSTDGAYYTSKEGVAGLAPQLVITTAPPTTITPTLTSTSTVTFTPTTQPSGPGLFSDGFESGNLSKWISVQGLTIQQEEVATGNFAARGTSAAGAATYARALLSSAQNDIYYRFRFKVISQGVNPTSLIKFRTASDVSILSVGLNSLGQLSYHNDVTGFSFANMTSVPFGSWQTLQVHVRIADTASQIEVWHNDIWVSALSQTDSFGTNPIGRLQLGENTPGLTYDIAFDDVVADTNYIAFGPTPTFTPTFTPTSTFTATATSTITPTTSFTSTASVTNTLTKTSTVTSTITPSASPTSTPTTMADTETFTPTASYTITPTMTPTLISTVTSSFTPVASTTNTPTLTSADTETSTLISSDTSTPTLNFADTETVTPNLNDTNTPTLTLADTETFTPTVGDTSTPALTSVVTDTFTPTTSDTSTPTLTLADTETVTPTVSATSTPTLTLVDTETFTPTASATRTPTLTSTSTTNITNTFTFTSTLTITPTSTTNTQPETLTFAPIADTYVRSDQPTSNFGSSTQIVADNSPVNNMLLKFTVSGVGNYALVSAKLRLYCVNGSPFGGEFHRVANTSWGEGTVNWNTSPVADPGILATLSSVAAGSWYEVNLASLVTGDGTYSLRVNSTSTDGAYYSSKEDTAGFAPQLVIIVSGSTAVPTQVSTLTNTPTRTPTPSATIQSSVTMTNTPSLTPTLSRTLTPTITRTPTFTPTRTSTQLGTLTFAPVADTYVQSDQPTVNFGTNTQIVADNSPVRNMLLKFNVTGIGAQTIVSARLRLYCVDGSPFGGEFHRVANTSWSEGTVNWNNAPVADPGILATLSPVAAGSWYEVNVASLVTGDGTYSLKVNSASTDGAYYSAKEGAAGFVPQLVIITAP